MACCAIDFLELPHTDFKERWSNARVKCQQDVIVQCCQSIQLSEKYLN